jgi:hypothetical protein
MQQHGSHCLSDVLNRSLGDAILEVGVHATVRYCLLLLAAVSFEGVVCKTTIVCMILFDANVVIR